MRALKLLPTPGLHINKKNLKRVYKRIYERTMLQLGSHEAQNILSDKKVVKKLVDRHVRRQMRKYGFALV